MQRFKFKKINGVHSIRCNQQCSAFTIATERGVKVYSMDPLALRVNLKANDVGSCTIAELLYESNLMAVVGGGGGAAEKFDEKSVVLVNIETGKVLLDITFDSCVLAVRFTKDKLVVAIPEQIHVFHLGTFKKIITLKTGYNHRGLCEVSDSGMMVFPAPNKGHVQVVDLNQLKDGTTVSPIIINAHEGGIACLAISHSGKAIATASEKGTLLRVFNVATKKKEAELRRGCDTAVVYSIAFSPCDGFFSVCSDKGTVHVFAVRDLSLNKSYMLRPVGNLLPNSYLGKALDVQRSMAQFAVPAECPSVLAYLDNQVIVAISVDGTFQKYLVTMQGHCKQKISAFTLDMGDDFTI